MEGRDLKFYCSISKITGKLRCLQNILQLSRDIFEIAIHSRSISIQVIWKKLKRVKLTIPFLKGQMWRG